MSGNNKVNNQNIKRPLLREATERDISQLGIHHRKMFEEIWVNKCKCLDPSICKEIEEAYVQKLKQELLNGTCKAWVVEHENRIIASGAISIVSFVPSPYDLSSNVAYLHSMYTEKEYRNNGFANLIINKAIQYCKDHKIKRMILNASEAGRPVYEKLGFRPAPDTMRLIIE